MQHLRSIHYLRGVAAIMVVIFHIFSNIEFMRPQLSEVTWLRGGVDIFFVISGYVMVRSTEDRQVSPGQFMLQRIKRIVPIYWIATVATMMNIQGQWNFKLMSLLFIPAMNPSINAMQPVLKPGWTLNYEMFFYAIFALSLLSARKYQFSLMAFSIISIVIMGWAVNGSEIFEFYSSSIIAEFLLGMAIAKFKIELPIIALPSGFMLMLALEPLLFARVIELGVPAMLIVSGALSAEKYIPHWKIADLLGSASYSIYLFHLLALVVALHTFPYLGISHAGFVILSLVFCIVVGCAFYLALEKPIIAYFASLNSAQRQAKGI